MPTGSRHDETGLLLTDQDQLVLQRDGGGTWRLDTPRKIGRLAVQLTGRRVRITGIRADFDLLDVESMTAL